MPRRPLCQCGHSFSSHRGDTSKHHEKGRCKAVVYDRDAQGSATNLKPCPCGEYRPRVTPEIPGADGGR